MLETMDSLSCAEIAPRGDHHILLLPDRDRGRRRHRPLGTRDFPRREGDHSGSESGRGRGYHKFFGDLSLLRFLVISLSPLRICVLSLLSHAVRCATNICRKSIVQKLFRCSPRGNVRAAKFQMPNRLANGARAACLSLSVVATSSGMCSSSAASPASCYLVNYASFLSNMARFHPAFWEGTHAEPFEAAPNDS